MHRDLGSDGCRNVRDLAGLPLAGGGTTTFGRVIRSDNPSRLTALGWEALRAHGIGTVVTLRTIDAVDPDPDLAVVPPGIVVERVNLEDATDPEFRRRCVDTKLWATPLEWAEMPALAPIAAPLPSPLSPGPGPVESSSHAESAGTGPVSSHSSSSH
jgi:protein-tyrosine phosphatase